MKNKSSKRKIRLRTINEKNESLTDSKNESHNVKKESLGPNTER